MVTVGARFPFIRGSNAFLMGIYTYVDTPKQKEDR